MNNLGIILKNGRENKNLTQQKVMELTGINKKSLSGYENDVAEPDLDTFASLLKLYELSADVILELKPGKSYSTLNKYERQMLTLFRSLDEQHQKELLIQLNALTKYLASAVQERSPD